MEPAMGFEPATACLQNRCSTIELRRQKWRSAWQTLTEKKLETCAVDEDGFQPLITTETYSRILPSAASKLQRMVAPRGLEPRTN